MTLGFLPIGSLAILFIKNEKLRKKGFHNRWGALYSNLNLRHKIDSKWSRAFTLIFVIRRIIYIFTSFYLTGSTIVQVLIIIFFQVSMLIYQGDIRPGRDRITNRFDMFNEMLVLICKDTFIVFTDWLPNKEAQFQVGWYWMSFLLLTMLINLVYIIFLSLRDIKLMYVKYSRIYRQKYEIYL